MEQDDLKEAVVGHSVHRRPVVVRHRPDEDGEILEQVLGKGGKESKVARRAAWMREHLDAVLEWYKVERTGRWEVEPLIVVSQELFTPYLRRSPIRILSFDRLMGEQG